MAKFDCKKYKAFEQPNIENREWPNNRISSAPIWCSVDLRDGNQALMEPMSVSQKIRLFNLLLEIGFKEVEVGFPAASKMDYEFIRYIIDENLIPEDVTIQVLTQARSEIIEKTFQSVKGAKNVILHVYNSTSPVQRKNVFNKPKNKIIEIATTAAQEILNQSLLYPETNWTFQYSPESFSGTEIDFSIDICDAVSDIWQPTPNKPMHVALPSTVEVSTPNIYADQIELFCKQIKRRDSIIVSTHTHNDRGCAVAAAELGLMAGAQRVEGTLLGNGERTGNMDIITMAMNMYSQGINPNIDFSEMDNIIKIVSECIQMEVNPRHPYCGELVYTAFSGSHQDAISKCFKKYKEGDIWDVAYLPIDPQDIGKTYQNIIRINSQSGKGGVNYVIYSKININLPYWLQIEFATHIQKYCDDNHAEVTHEEIWELFNSIYLTPSRFIKLNEIESNYQSAEFISLEINGVAIEFSSKDTFNDIELFLKKRLGLNFTLIESESKTSENSNSNNVLAYVKLEYLSKQVIGISIGKNSNYQKIKALFKAVDNILISNSEKKSIVETI